jgi:hypothetical protein
MNQTICDRIIREQLAIHEIIWLPGNACYVGDQFKSLIEEDPEDVAEALGIGEDEFNNVVADSDNEWDVVVDYILDRGKTGFLVQASTPVVEDGKLGGWYYTFNKWFYTEAFDDALLDRLVAWRDSAIAKRASKKGSE